MELFFHLPYPIQTFSGVRGYDTNSSRLKCSKFSSPGLNLQRHPSLTIATLYRWLDLLDQDKAKAYYAPYKLWRVTVTEYDVLRYSAVRNGLPLDPSSMELVQPGDYAAYSGVCFFFFSFQPKNYGANRWRGIESYDNQLYGRRIDGNSVGKPRRSFHERESMLGSSAYDPDEEFTLLHVCHFFSSANMYSTLFLK